MSRARWRWLNSDLRKLTETQVKRLLDMEMDYDKRPRYVVRLHARLTRLRAQRELAELLEKLD